MYPIKLGYHNAIKRIRKLLRNGHSAEALVTSVFTVEKTFRRTLRQIVVSAGFATKYADKIIRRLGGMEAIKTAWELYEPDHSPLTEIITAEDWKTFKYSAEMRNKIVHGERVYELKACKLEAEKVLKALSRAKSKLEDRYSYSGWTPLSVRKKSRLHTDSKVHKNHPGQGSE